MVPCDSKRERERERECENGDEAWSMFGKSNVCAFARMMIVRLRLENRRIALHKVFVISRIK